MQLKRLVVALLVMFSFSAFFSCQEDGQKDDKKDEQKEQQKQQDKKEAAKEDEKKGDEPEPRTYEKPEAVSYYKASDDVLADEFLPVGWSEKGNFAYITEFADEACGCYSMAFTIVNQEAKDTLWNWTFESMDYEETLPDVWKKQKDVFSEKLNEFGIIPQDNFAVLDPHFSVNSQKYRIELETETETDPYFGFDVVKKGRISLVSPEGKRHVRTFTEPSPSMILGAVVQGVLKSPHSGHLMIIYKRERRGYEGPPHVVTFRLAGTKL